MIEHGKLAKVIGKRLKALRLDNGLTRKQVAKDLDVDVGFIIGYERGGLPPSTYYIYSFCWKYTYNPHKILPRDPYNLEK